MHSKGSYVVKITNNFIVNQDAITGGKINMNFIQ